MMWTKELMPFCEIVSRGVFVCVNSGGNSLNFPHILHTDICPHPTSCILHFTPALETLSRTGHSCTLAVPIPDRLHSVYSYKHCQNSGQAIHPASDIDVDRNK